MLIAESMGQDSIEIAERAAGAAYVIARLSERIGRDLGISKSIITGAVLARERSRSTALPNGAAVPHCRLPGVERFAAGLMVLRTPIAWDDVGTHVDTVLMIAGPAASVSDHLRILANSSRLLGSPALRDKLRRAPDSPSARALLAAAEEAIEQRRASEGILTEVSPEVRAMADHLAEVAARFDW